MRSFRRAISLFVSVFMIMAFFMVPVSAGGTYEPTSGYVSAGGYFSAGSSVFFAQPSSVTVEDGKYDVYLESYIYDGMTTNARPYNTYTYLRAYTLNHSAQAGELASFGAAGYGYSYQYKSGYGTYGHTYCLKANSSNTSLGAAVSTRWHA